MAFRAVMPAEISHTDTDARRAIYCPGIAQSLVSACTIRSYAFKCDRTPSPPIQRCHRLSGWESACEDLRNQALRCYRVLDSG